MLLPVFQDLIKPQWCAVLEELKLSGTLPMSELARQVNASYMAVKQHCEELNKLGYLDRSRVPRTAVGRPEIFYSLSAKADRLFPQPGLTFILSLLAELKSVHGDSAPDKLLFQYFQKLQDAWQPLLDKAATVHEKATKLAALRAKEGGVVHCFTDANGSCHLKEYHNPLQRIFEKYPRAIAMEQRLIETLLGSKVSRQELSGGRSGQPRVIFQTPILAAKSL
jgi:predicted ArsR family transcriptional regulator